MKSSATQVISCIKSLWSSFSSSLAWDTNSDLDSDFSWQMFDMSDMSPSLGRRKCSWVCFGESMVNPFRICRLSLDSDHKTLYLHIGTKNSHIDQCIRVLTEKRYIMVLAMKKLIYMQMRLRVTSCLSLNKDMKKNWE